MSVSVAMTVVMTVAVVMMIIVTCIVWRSVRSVRVIRCRRSGPFHSMTVMLGGDGAETRVEHSDAVAVVVPTPALRGARAEIT